MPEMLGLSLGILAVTILGGFLAWMVTFAVSGRRAQAEQRRLQGTSSGAPVSLGHIEPRRDDSRGPTTESPAAVLVVLVVAVLGVVFAGIGLLPVMLIPAALGAALYVGVRAVWRRRPVKP